MLIDSTYFKGMLSIGLSPDTGAPSITQEAERERIEWFISVYEKSYLKELLGGEMCDKFVSYCEQGKSDDKYFNQLKERLTAAYSPVACYVFYKFVRTGNIHVTNVGSVKSSGDDAVSPSALLVRVWNDMVQMNRDIADDFLLEPASDLTSYINEFGV